MSVSREEPGRQGQGAVPKLPVGISCGLWGGHEVGHKAGTAWAQGGCNASSAVVGVAGNCSDKATAKNQSKPLHAEVQSRFHGPSVWAPEW